MESEIDANKIAIQRVDDEQRQTGSQSERNNLNILDINNELARINKSLTAKVECDMYDKEYQNLKGIVNHLKNKLSMTD